MSPGTQSAEEHKHFFQGWGTFVKEWEENGRRQKEFGITKEELESLLETAVAQLDLETKVQHNLTVQAIVKEVVTQVLQKCGKEDDEKTRKTAQKMIRPTVGQAVGAIKSAIKRGNATAS